MGTKKKLEKLKKALEFSKLKSTVYDLEKRVKVLEELNKKSEPK